MLDILFTIVLVLMFILCFSLHRRCKNLQRQIDQINDRFRSLLEKEEASADADGVDDRSE